jgi:hypothetical protein
MADALIAGLSGYLMRLEVEEREGRGPSGPLGEKLRGIRQQEIRRVTTLKTQAEKELGNPHLSQDGKRARVAELATKADMSVLTTVRTETQAHRARLHTLLFAMPTSKEDPVLVRLDAREIRDSVKGLSQPKIDQIYLDAVTAGQHEKVRALTTGPLGSLVSAEFQQRVEEDHAQHSQPAVYENYQQVTLLQEHLDGLHDHASRALKAMGAADPAKTDADPRKPVAA